MTPSLLLQRLLPLHWLTRCAGRLAASRRAWIAQPLIQTYARRYGVDLAEAALANPRAYESFNAFFARALDTMRATNGRARQLLMLPAPASGMACRLRSLPGRT